MNLSELVGHHGVLAHHQLVLVVQELDQLRDGPGCQVCVILIVYQVDHGMLQHLAGMGGLGGVQLGGGDLQTFIPSLREHGGLTL